MNLPELQRISEDQIRKIYPEIYYKKYANHVNVLKLQQEILREDPRSPNNHPPKEETIPELPEVPAKVQYNARYDDYKTIIQSNKLQVSRMAKYTKVLSMKLETSPSKKQNWIRSPVKERHQIDEKMLARLKAIEDLEYEKQLKERERRKKYLEERSLCRFVMRSKSNQISPRYDPDFQAQPFETNPEFQTFNSCQSSQQKPRHKLQQLTNSKKLSRHASFSGSRGSFKKQKASMSSKQIVTNTLKSLETESTYYEVKKNLIEQTKKIRQQVQSMETLSFYDAVVLKKKRQQMLNLL